MKYHITNYEDYLDLSLNDIEKLSETFDDLSDTEFGILDSYHLQFNYELDKAVQERENNQSQLVVEERTELRLLTDDEFYNWPMRKILLFFEGKLNEE